MLIRQKRQKDNKQIWGLFEAKLGRFTQHVTEESLGCRIKSRSINLVLQIRLPKESGKLLPLFIFVASLNSREIVSEKFGAIFKMAIEMTWISIS